MSLTLRYRGETTLPVEVDGLLPAALRELGLPQIERFTIHHGNQKLPLAEWFDVSGDAADLRIDLEGDLSGVHSIGSGLCDGTIHIHGPAGRHVGSGMRGGEIVVNGDAGDWLGAEMRGGMLRVKGNAGNLVGAAYRGSPRGMRGGTILVSGHAGHE
ncbi:MAG: formylmethanofuran dehydrogenase subunit C, partial [Pirellulales bacterium]